MHRNTMEGRRMAMLSKAPGKSQRNGLSAISKLGGITDTGVTPWIRQAAAYSPKVGEKIRAVSSRLRYARASR